MRVVISGSHGFIGSALKRHLLAAGAAVAPLYRAELNQLQECAALEGADLVIHLAGENLGQRWTVQRKERFRSSRIDTTRSLAQALSELKPPPPLLLVASAMGYYGDRGEDALSEDASPGVGFLADLCRDWEAAADPARQHGIRVVHLRFGLVLGRGGVLDRLVPLFRWGLGGVLGNGRQQMSWISMDDVVGAIDHIIAHPHIHGPVNMGSPTPVTNRRFTQTLAEVVKRPALCRVPSIVLKTFLGEMARETLLVSTRMVPGVLLESGFQFAHPELRDALEEAMQPKKEDV